jgi:hypothetical protein
MSTDFIITRNKIPVGYIETKDIGKPLSVYQRIVAVLAETIRLMAAVDEAIAARGGWPIG